MATEVTLSILGSHFRVVAEDPRMADLVEELWRPFVSAGGPNEVEVRIGPYGDTGWRLDVADESPISAQDPWLLASSARNALSRTAIRNATSIVPLHAAAVERDGVFAVLSGPPRAGKTTLLLDLLGEGWSLVTDDLVPVDPETLTATPFAKPLSVRDPARWREVSGGWAVPEWLPPPDQVGLVPATALRRSEVDSYAPSVLVFPHYDPDSSPAFRPLTAAETVAWCGDNLHTRGPGAPGVLAVLARLAAGAPGYAISYGSSAEALELLAKCLAGEIPME
jgi:hypothetical protein